jgi:dynein heavy chain, axonemal
MVPTHTISTCYPPFPQLRPLSRPARRFSPSGTYTTVAEADTAKGMLDVIRGLPIVPKPEIFGLHANADITCDQAETYGMFATLLSLQPRVAGGAGGQSQEEVRACVLAC